MGEVKPGNDYLNTSIRIFAVAFAVKVGIEVVETLYVITMSIMKKAVG